MGYFSGFLLLILAGVMFYAFHLHKKLQHYQTKLRRLKDAVHAVAPAGEQLDALLISMNEVVLRLDAKGLVMGANRKAQSVFALEADSLPVSLRQVYRDADWNEAVQAALAIMPEHTCLPDMQADDFIFSPRLAELSTGELLLLCVDVTEQRRLEQQRRTFLSNLMHDLKTPLTSLLGYARSLERFGDDAVFRKDAGTVIADEAKHVNHLLDALLTLDQIEFSTRNEDAACVLVEVLDQVFDLLQSIATDKDIVLLREGGREGDVLDCRLAIVDDELERILTNILVNAINYSPVGGQVVFAVRLANQMCNIVIEDAGSGIPEDDLPRVTERFYRVDKARTRKAGGHGLGLAIVKELIEKNTGSLKLSNRSEGGLRVEIVLPLLEKEG